MIYTYKTFVEARTLAQQIQNVRCEAEAYNTVTIHAIWTQQADNHKFKMCSECIH